MASGASLLKVPHEAGRQALTSTSIGCSSFDQVFEIAWAVKPAVLKRPYDAEKTSKQSVNQGAEKTPEEPLLEEAERDPQPLQIGKLATGSPLYKD